MSLSAPQARRPPLAFASAGGRGPPCMAESSAEIQRTFVAIKPEGETKGLLGDIIRRFEKHEHKMIGMKLVHPSLSQAQCHYRRLANKPYFRDLCEHFISGPVVLMVWEGCNAVGSVQELMHVYEDNRGRELHGGVNPPHRHHNSPSNLLHNIAHTSESVCYRVTPTPHTPLLPVPLNLPSVRRLRLASGRLTCGLAAAS